MRYKVTDIIGTSSNSWEEAAAEAVRTVRQTIRDVRVAEVSGRTYTSRTTADHPPVEAAVSFQVRVRLLPGPGGRHRRSMGADRSQQRE